MTIRKVFLLLMEIQIMNKFLLIILSLTAIHHYSQNSSEQRTKSFDREASYKLGKEKLDKEFIRALTYTVSENYVINGVVTFSLYVNDTGFAKIVDIKPKFKNHQLLLDDLNYVLRKTNKNWEPAEKNNKKVSSIYQYEITFNTEVYDHD